MTVDDAISYGRAFRPGDVVVLKVRVPLSQQAEQVLHDQLGKLFQETGVRLVALPLGIDVVDRVEGECDDQATAGTSKRPWLQR